MADGQAAEVPDRVTVGVEERGVVDRPGEERPSCSEGPLCPLEARRDRCLDGSALQALDDEREVEPEEIARTSASTTSAQNSQGRLALA